MAPRGDLIDDHTTKNDIFNHETRKFTAHIFLRKSHHVVKNGQNISLIPSHSAFFLQIFLIVWSFSYPDLY